MRLGRIKLRHGVLAFLCTLTLASVILFVLTVFAPTQGIDDWVDHGPFRVSRARCCLSINYFFTRPEPVTVEFRHNPDGSLIEIQRSEDSVMWTQRHTGGTLQQITTRGSAPLYIAMGESINRQVFPHLLKCRGLLTFDYITKNYKVELRFPSWVPMAVFGLYPAFILAGWIRARRRHAGMRCPQCGYDVRATPDTCPECGYCMMDESNATTT